MTTMDDYERQAIVGHNLKVEMEARRIAEEKQNGLLYKTGRFFTRAARIACGLLIAFGAFYVFSLGPDIGDVPFSALTLKMIAANLASWIFGFVLLACAFNAAFGSGPDEHELIKKYWVAAESAVKAADERARMNT